MGQTHLTVISSGKPYRGCMKIIHVDNHTISEVCKCLVSSEGWCARLWLAKASGMVPTPYIIKGCIVLVVHVASKAHAAE